MSHGASLLLFGVHRSAPVKLVRTELEKLTPKLDAMGVTWSYHDVTEDVELADTYSIASLPALVLVLEGRKLNAWTGAFKPEGMLKELHRTLAKTPKGV